jgi:hypothetical protein
LRLIQHNWVVLAYNLNVEILMLITGGSSIGAFSAYHFYYNFILIISLHKCTQPCYFPLLLKPATQKEKMEWNSSTRSSRLRVAPDAVPVELWSLLLFCFIESHHSL